MVYFKVDKTMVSGQHVMKKPRSQEKWAEPKRELKSRVTLRCQRRAAGLNPKLKKVKEVEWSSKKKIQGEAKGEETKGSCVSCGGGRICKLRTEGVHIMVPAVDAGVEGIWSVVSIGKSKDSPAAVPSQFSKHIFWHAQCPGQCCISDNVNMMQTTAFRSEEQF